MSIPSIEEESNQNGKNIGKEIRNMITTIKAMVGKTIRSKDLISRLI
jgi:hypothetical protein